MSRQAAALPSYAAGAQGYDEAIDADGALRPHWRVLGEEIARGGAAQMRQRRRFIARQIREHGVTYNVYDEARGAERPWDLDPLPNPIPAAEWQALADGIAQRAAVLDAVLADLYGAQTLLRDGLLPPELVFGNPDFLRPCAGIVPPGGRFLHLYAADLVRAPDGGWRVLADCTQAPSGAGYALENRQILSRACAEVYRALHVRPLDGFFRSLQTHLRRHAPGDAAAPLAVLLTPGIRDESHFEHVYLARALGLPLVEGQDLTVRGARVFLKTLAGLQRVHAILRRVDAQLCDPLELGGDSALGVPGLLSAVRAGEVLVANALGSGVAESPALLGYLPRICEHVRGEPLRLPSAATWWCGEAAARAAVLAQLDRLVVKPASPRAQAGAVFVHALSAAQRDRLRARILADPQSYVAQERIESSQAPAWGAASAPRARAIGMRVYAVASENGYEVMPGALTRVAARKDAPLISMRRGGGSKDTWVQGDADEAAPPRSVAPPRAIVRTDAFLPSRLVENLFWLGRYSERSDNIARLLRVLRARSLDGGSEGVALAGTLEVCRLLDLAPAELAPKPALHAVLDGGGSRRLRDTLERLVQAAGNVRGRLSQENWRGVNELQREAAALAEPQADMADALELLDRLLMALSALTGFALDDMTHDEGWRFLVVGRRIERLQFLADAAAAVLRDLARSGEDAAPPLDWLLELADSIITYRMRYLSAPTPAPAFDLVLLDALNPHAVLFQVGELQREFAAIGADEENRVLSAAAAALSAFDLARLESADAADGGDRAAWSELADLLGALAQHSRDIAERLAARHFAHVDAVSLATRSS